MTEASTLPSYLLNEGIAVITLDDGKANAFGDEVLEVLEGLLDRMEADGARALVLMGREGMFSAGFNLKEMTASVEGMQALVARGARWLLRLYGLGVPTVAACTGHALAAGAITLMACDVRLGADVPAKIGLTEVGIGMPLPIFAVEFARDRLTKSSFVASTLHATVYDPAGAAKVGYLDRVVPRESLLDEAMAEARRLAEFRTGAYARTKTNARNLMIEACLAGLEADIASVEGPAT